MNSFNPTELMTRAFTHLRQNGFSLGVGELLAARRAIAGGFGETPQELFQTLKIIWCHSPAQQSQFLGIWEFLQIPSTPETAELTPTSEEIDEIELTQNTQLPEISPPLPETKAEVKPEPVIESLPVQAPSFTSLENEDTFRLQLHYPLNRRSMIYGWRHLSQLVADGPPNVLDVKATIEQVTQQGFYLAPVYRRQMSNHAHLLLLIDQNGSMTPLHRFTRELMETATNKSSDLQPEKVNVYYFHNIPGNFVYQDLYLTKPISLDEILANCDNGTSMLIVSDAGAARGYRKLRRIRATTSFLFQLKRYSSLIAWLNPMPKDRWIGSSAEIIAYLVPMYYMDKDGLSNAIDILRGQSLSSLD